MSEGWPHLDSAAHRPTTETIHLLLQLIGKLPLRLLPWINHGWHVALRISPRGAVTRCLPADGAHFTVELDFLAGAVTIQCNNGTVAQLPVAGLSIAAVQEQLAERLAALGLPAPLHGAPNEMSNPVPFRDDHAPREWDPDSARRLHGAFLAADRCFTAFRALYRGKTSPSHLFWGSLDLAVTRFSGRPAPVHPGGIPALPDEVTREAYSHEVISAGFWPGSGAGSAMEEAAFYAYAYPVPEGLAKQPVMPSAAFWHEALREFVLPYAAVRASADPDAEVQAFLASSYAVAARLLDWPDGLASSMQSPPGRPPPAG